ncbi:FAD/NAD(P)-binding domain-containing protein [Neolentinus lepideus HHB14362 ss-1]|uniref:FAD/NAD(P)-binding domain-containing protein n=1 Tax=Neolentinus lepideus HHB14362 ss-1 TaxID=1314782 RepID=A0A165RUZ7_9AGAM|nr:FAD/NAD(P)-binding domain-containing protein [Neolentinus lepideus HHB14362 ss-1]
MAFITEPLPSAVDKSSLNDISDGFESLPYRPEAVNGPKFSAGPALPTLDKLGVEELPEDVNALDFARKWINSFAQYISSCDVEGLLSLLVEDAFWRDILAMTWDFRTLHTKPRIRQFLLDRLSVSKLNSLRLDENMVELERPYPDLAWIQALFKFETDVGKGSGVFRLVPLPESNGALEWKAHLILTTLDELKGFPEKIGRLREQSPNHGKWQEQRRREMEFRNEDPKVLVAGAGHAGLEIAARLKYLDIPTLVVERHPRVGDNWRTRYEYLHLHTLVGVDHMAYLPFPSTWPQYPAASKLAGWMESYAHTLELNVWTSSEVIGAEQDESTKNWIVTVRRLETGQERTFTVNHLVCAVGWGGGLPKMPVYPGMEQFKGRVMHSSQHKVAKDHIGKKVVVVGSGTSAHDICSDHVENGVDVTMVQRSPTYIMSVKEGVPRVYHIYNEGGPSLENADLITASYPNPLLKLMHQRLTNIIAEADETILDGLRRRGFKLSMGDEGSGSLTLAWTRGGGYYLDVGASQMIIDGTIKLKNDSLIDRFTETGIKFQDGSELPCDIVIFATGYQKSRDGLIKLLGNKFSSKIKPIWDVDAEGEFNGAWRDIGVPNLWCMMGGLGQCRLHSKHLALQIKALQEGIWNGSRYSA